MKRGFGSPAYSRERQREVARLGGKAGHQRRKGKRRSHEWTAEEARLAGMKGGRASAESKRRKREAA